MTRLRLLAFAAAGALLLLVPGACAPAQQRALIGLDPPLEPTRLRLGPTPLVEGCRSPSDGLRILSERLGDTTDPASDTQGPMHGWAAVGSWSSSWAEARVLRLGFTEDGRRVNVRAELHTDYGDFGARVRGEGARVHRHTDRVCFELTVERLEGHVTRERWIGALALVED